MSVIVFAEHQNGLCKKQAFEAVTYGAKTAALLGTSCTALTFGSPSNGAELGNYGASRVIDIRTPGLEHFDSLLYTQIIADVVGQEQCKVVILTHSSTGRTLAGRLAIRLNAGLVSGVNALPQVEDHFSVDRSVYSGKAIATYRMDSEVKVISVMGNSIAPEISGQPAPMHTMEILDLTSQIQIKEVSKQDGTVPLPEAELVVSGGRGFKGPENWGILEELAEALGAATACSRPVADNGWRPHHEHVGQTGVAIRPNLYIAIGISGAIQHLGGVNNSRTIVVINKDPEAPFFKAADYGVVGDLFEVVPRLTAAVKRFRTQ